MAYLSYEICCSFEIVSAERRTFYRKWSTAKFSKKHRISKLTFPYFGEQTFIIHSFFSQVCDGKKAGKNLLHSAAAALIAHLGFSVVLNLDQILQSLRCIA